MLPIPNQAASSRAMAIISGAMSMPSTLPVAPTRRAAVKAGSPSPVATSSTRWPVSGPFPDRPVSFQAVAETPGTRKNGPLFTRSIYYARSYGIACQNLTPFICSTCWRPNWRWPVGEPRRRICHFAWQSYCWPSSKGALRP